MPLTLAQALGQLELQPGQTYREKVNGHHVELRVLADDEPTPDVAVQVMVSVPSFAGERPGRAVVAVPGPVPPPDPPDLPSDDGAP